MVWRKSETNIHVLAQHFALKQIYSKVNGIPEVNMFGEQGHGLLAVSCDVVQVIYVCPIYIDPFLRWLR